MQAVYNENQTSKKCPFCAELIQAEAIKCRFCNEWLDGEAREPATDLGTNKPKSKWYHSPLTLIAAVLCVGPLALPLVWTNKNYNTITKAVITIAVIGLTVWLCYITVKLYASMLNQLDVLNL
jgi:hypothetical protein